MVKPCAFEKKKRSSHTHVKVTKFNALGDYVTKRDWYSFLSLIQSHFFVRTNGISSYKK